MCMDGCRMLPDRRLIHVQKVEKPQGKSNGLAMLGIRTPKDNTPREAVMDRRNPVDITQLSERPCWEEGRNSESEPVPFQRYDEGPERQ